jgi:HemK-like putative methylase
LRDKYGGKRTTAAKRDIARLQQGEHVSYVIGWTPFVGCRVDLSQKPLIPRPETEYWTEKAIDMIRASGIARPSVLDLFCGSGCIGLAVLKHLSAARVEFADINSKYLAGIKKSIRASEVTGRRARYTTSDVFAGVGNREYDFILANPPYIPTKGRAVAKSVLAQEPRPALFAGKDGLKYIYKLLREGKRHLKTGGVMIVEFDPPQKRAIGAYARARGWNAKFLKDQHGRWRFACFSGGA